jgi:FMN phosphatase YigB (HAD superfamily)
MNHPYVCFDVGNVLVSVNFSQVSSNIARLAGVALEEANYFLVKTQKFHDLGIITLEEAFKDHFQFSDSDSYQELLQHWDESLSFDLVIKDFLSELNAKGVKIALLSNIGAEHASILDREWGKEKWYQQAIHFYSYEVGARKPSVLYYQSFLLQYPKFKNALYLDDLQPNLEMGRKMGFRTLRFSLDDLRDDDYQQNVIQEIQKVKALIYNDETNPNRKGLKQ